MRPTKRRILFLPLILLGITVAIWGTYAWKHYPHAPDPATANMADLVHFVGSSDFNRLYGWDQKQYSMQVVDRLNRMKFNQLVGVIADRSSAGKAALDNIRQMPGGDQVIAGIVRVFLAKFYQQTPAEREACLLFYVLSEKWNPDDRPAHDGMPDLNAAQRDMRGEISRLMQQQPPETVAQAGQFILDLKQKRELLHVPDRF